MHTIDVHYAVHGEGGIPLWVLLCVLALVLWLTHRWNRRERQGRRGQWPVFLPWTLTLLLLLVAAAFYNPVVVKSTTLEGDKRVIALIDDSQSMDLPLALEGLSDRLDASALWRGKPLPGRSTAAGDLARLISELRSGTPEQRETALHLEAQHEQGMPLGPSDSDRQESYSRWRDDGLAALGRALAALQQEEKSEKTPRSLEPLQALLDLITTLPQSLDADEAPREVARRLDALIATADTAEQFARGLQTSADRAWLDGPGKAVSEESQTVTSRTRGELARKLVEALPDDTVTVPSQTPRITRLARSVTDALRQNNETPISHLLLFSDGADRGGEDELAGLQRLGAENITFLTVGADFSVPVAPDVAILDWFPAPVVQAGNQATLKCTVKFAPGRAATLQLKQGETVLSQTKKTPGEYSIVSMTVSYKAPPPGRHTFVLQINTEGDTTPGNNKVSFVQDSVERLPDLLLVDDVPDWDSAYLALAARRVGLRLRQAHAAGKSPERGGFSSAVPLTLAQWSRYAGVFLRGTAFPGFDSTDAETLRDLVTKEGRTLVVMNGQGDSWLEALAGAFGWKAASEEAESGLAVPADTCHLPAISMASDPDDGRIRFAALPRPRRARTVPKQDIVLMADERGRPVCSLGFHGRGKVILCGLDGLAPMRRFAGATVIDRFCDSLVAAAATQLFADGAKLTTYPALPDRGRDTWLISLLESTEGDIDGAAKPLTEGRNNRIAGWKPDGEKTTVKIGPAQWEATTADNPGLELRYPEFRPERLQELADAGKGTFASIRTARQTLAGIEPQTWQTMEASVYRPGRHWLLFAGLLIAAALHWVLRKLAGLAI